mmetsp:Transcript_14685/g.31171  ORF Transcript_14685/g.31171 Transcript_14685/m.31171 type:complete len:105 (-) Transcript_14685:261-575(-)
MIEHNFQKGMLCITKDDLGNITSIHTTYFLSKGQHTNIRQSGILSCMILDLSPHNVHSPINISPRSSLHAHVRSTILDAYPKSIAADFNVAIKSTHLTQDMIGQ